MGNAPRAPSLDQSMLPELFADGAQRVLLCSFDTLHRPMLAGKAPARIVQHLSRAPMRHAEAALPIELTEQPHLDRVEIQEAAVDAQKVGDRVVSAQVRFWRP